MQKVTLEPKQPWEIVPYQFKFDKWITSADPITSVAFGVYLNSDDPASPTLITAMVYATDFTGTTSTCDVGSGSDTVGTYALRARVVCGGSGRRYEQEGIFVVKEL